MNFDDLLVREGIDPGRVLVLRHRPHEAGLHRVLPWLAAERPSVFNAYQQTQVEKLERSMARMVASLPNMVGRASTSPWQKSFHS